MRVCILAPVRSIHTRRWVESLAGRGHRVVYLNVSAEDAEFRDAECLPLKMGSGRAARLQRLRERRRVIRELRPDILHQHGVTGTPANLSLWRLPRLVVSSWGSEIVRESSDRPPPSRFWQRFLLRQAAAITATSRFLCDRTAVLAPRRAPLRVVPFGVDCSLFSPQSRARENGVTIGFVKHLERQYGPEETLRAFAGLGRHRDNVRLLMVGEGSQRARLEGLAGELGIAGRTVFAGAVPHEQVPSILGNVDIFVMPSTCQESFGVAALEASAMEVPVISTSVGGIPEVVLDGETGVLVPPGDVPALEAAMESLVEDAGLRERLGKQGRKWVLSRYTWEESLSSMEEVYSGVMVGNVGF